MEHGTTIAVIIAVRTSDLLVMTYRDVCTSNVDEKHAQQLKLSTQLHGSTGVTCIEKKSLYNNEADSLLETVGLVLLSR